ncbi:DUF547 domain-containing protein [Oceaniferula spumae]|uniref:DUF547 domain-containing protein n=1 Tax=Oceaniferula spumae TaxID=2979115 RepID=A0AAT9FMH0_9BACT
MLIALFTAVSSTLAMADWYSDYDGLLRKYVTPQGVKYKEWKANAADVQKLHGVTDAIAKYAPAGDYNAKLAFHLNAYNAWILRAVIDNYPMKSIKDVKTFFFKRYDIKVSGREMSFSHLENDIIRKKFKEPRIHFALNCASESCPPLLNKAFHGNTLGRSLDKLTKDFINSPRGVKVSGDKVMLSSIFDWYKEDFGDVDDYINKYRREKISGKISYQDYDWSLNEAR